MHPAATFLAKIPHSVHLLSGSDLIRRIICTAAAQSHRHTPLWPHNKMDRNDTGVAAPKRFRIYTRTGDGGTSTLYTGQRLPKDCAYFEALGDVDELNSAVGLAREFVSDTDKELADKLSTIQSRLIDVGSAVATPSNAAQSAKVSRTRFDPAHTALMESWIDAMDDTLPPLRHFILPSGGKAGAALHLARSVCRRAERSVVALARSGQPQQPPTLVPVQNGHDADAATAAQGEACSQGGGDEGVHTVTPMGGEEEVVDPPAIVYLNRLSDFLFTAARFTASKGGHPEVTYQKQ